MSRVHWGVILAVPGLTALALDVGLTDSARHRPDSLRWLLVGSAVIVLVGGVFQAAIGAFCQRRSP